MAKLVIWPSGKARPIESASTTGRPVTPATMSERRPLAPPISPDMTARKLAPRCFSMVRNGLAAKRGSDRRSSPTSGAPMPATSATLSSSARSIGSRSETRTPSS